MKLLYDPDCNVYSAGLLDSRGWITINCAERKNPRTGTVTLQHWLQVTIKCKRPVLLTWLKDQYGGSVHGIEHGGRWQITHAAARDFLMPVLNHLKIKKEQAALAIEFQNHMDAGHYSKSADRYEEVAWRDEIRRAIMALNG